MSGHTNGVYNRLVNEQSDELLCIGSMNEQIDQVMGTNEWTNGSH